MRYLRGEKGSGGAYYIRPRGIRLLPPRTHSALLPSRDNETRPATQDTLCWFPEGRSPGMKALSDLARLKSRYEGVGRAQAPKGVAKR